KAVGRSPIYRSAASRSATGGLSSAAYFSFFVLRSSFFISADKLGRAKKMGRTIRFSPCPIRVFVPLLGGNGLELEVDLAGDAGANFVLLTVETTLPSRTTSAFSV